MSVTTPVYMLPKSIRREVLFDCYNALLTLGKSKEEAKHEVSHCIVVSRLIDLENLVDVFKYRL